MFRAVQTLISSSLGCNCRNKSENSCYIFLLLSDLFPLSSECLQESSIGDCGVQLIFNLLGMYIRSAEVFGFLDGISRNEKNTSLERQQYMIYFISKGDVEINLIQQKMESVNWPHSQNLWYSTKEQQEIKPLSRFCLHSFPSELESSIFLNTTGS